MMKQTIIVNNAAKRECGIIQKQLKTPLIKRQRCHTSFKINTQLYTVYKKKHFKYEDTNSLNDDK